MKQRRAEAFRHSFKDADIGLVGPNRARASTSCPSLLRPRVSEKSRCQCAIAAKSWNKSLLLFLWYPSDFLV